MIYRVEEALDVGVHHVRVTGFQSAVYHFQGSGAAFSGPKPVAARAECRFEHRLQHLEHCLLHDPVADCRNTKRPHAAPAFGDQLATYRMRPVRLGAQILVQSRQTFLGLAAERLDGRAVGSASPVVFPNTLPGRRQVARQKHFVNQRVPLLLSC
jgi:hypothetical protein